MKQLHKIIAASEPKLITKTDGYSRYAYKIHEITYESKGLREEKPTKKKGYEFYLIDNLPLNLTYGDVVKAIIRSYYTESEEFDLINSYNKVQLGIEKNDKAVTKYKEYLQLLTDIKTTVKNEFALYNAK